MKDAAFTLNFTSHVLANGVSPGTPDVFQRDADNKLVFQQCWFYSAFTKAIEFTRMRGIKGSDIVIDLSVAVPTQMFDRRYGEGGAHVRTHEAIMPGTSVTFNAMVADHVTQDNLRSLLTCVGKYVGLSPYGFRLGYGKFTVAACTVAPSDAA